MTIDLEAPEYFLTTFMDNQIATLLVIKGCWLLPPLLGWSNKPFELTAWFASPLGTQSAIAIQPLMTSSASTIQQAICHTLLPPLGRYLNDVRKLFVFLDPLPPLSLSHSRNLSVLWSRFDQPPSLPSVRTSFKYRPFLCCAVRPLHSHGIGGGAG